MKIKFLAAFLLLMLIVVPLVGAQDEVLDNACDAGGSMEGKCTTDWHWICGWYVARYERAELTLEQVPVDCSTTLIIPYLPPTESAAIIEISPGVCAIVHTKSTFRTDLTASWGNPVAGQTKGVWTYDAVIVSNFAVSNAVTPSDTSDSVSIISMPGAPVGTPGTYQLQGAAGTLLGPIPCPVTINP